MIRNPSFRIWTCVSLILVVHAILCLSASKQKGIYHDDLPHLTAGYAHLFYGDHRFHPEAGILPKVWMNLPFLFDRVDYPEPSGSSFWSPANVWKQGYQFFYKQGGTIHDWMGGPRLMMILVSLVLGLVIFLWSRKLFGAGGGLFSLTLYAFCRGFIGHSFSLSADVAAALFFLLSAWTLVELFERVTVWRLVAAVLALAGLALTKFSGAMVGVVGVLVLLVSLTRGARFEVEFGKWGWAVTGRLRQGVVRTALLALIGGGVIIAIWGAYGWRYASEAAEFSGVPARLDWSWIQGKTESGHSFVWECLQAAREGKWLPEAFLFGAGTCFVVGQGVPSFFMGEYGFSGWTGYFPLLFLMKTPTPTLLSLIILILAAGAGLGLSRKVRQWVADHRLYLAGLLGLMVVYGVTAISSQLNIGHRHLLVIYPPLMILAGALVPLAVSLRGRWRRRALAGLGAMVIWLITVCLSVWPHYLSFFNLPSGGSQAGYRYFADSNVDWGQDLPALERWWGEFREVHGADQRLYLGYFGNDLPEAYDLDAEVLYDLWWKRDPFPLPRPGAGTYAISTNVLQGYLLSFYGPAWTGQYEADFQRMKRELRPLLDPEVPVEARAEFIRSSDPANLRFKVGLYRQMVVARLCGMLRQMQPDKRIGNSIMVYHLDEAEVSRAIAGPAPERKDVPW